jgi:hypothetical protein
MPDEGASMEDQPKSGRAEKIAEHYDQRRPQDRPMPEFEVETRREESSRAAEAAEQEGDEESESPASPAG